MSCVTLKRWKGARKTGIMTQNPCREPFAIMYRKAEFFPSPPSDFELPFGRSSRQIKARASSFFPRCHPRCYPCSILRHWLLGFAAGQNLANSADLMGLYHN
jgi:hypothetical protein